MFLEPEERWRFVARGGLLHDVGKTPTPIEILYAPPVERRRDRGHPRPASIGASMIREIERLPPFVPLVRYHHERVDGSGYPDRLDGAQIPLDVRIVTVFEQLVEQRGRQFDALVVEAMIDIVGHPE